jgi:hypothetical protein
MSDDWDNPFYSREEMAQHEDIRQRVEEFMRSEFPEIAKDATELKGDKEIAWIIFSLLRGEYGDWLFIDPRELDTGPYRERRN